MPQGNSESVTTWKVEGGSQARAEIKSITDEIKALLAVMNSGGGASPALRPAPTVTAPGAPVAPLPPAASAINSPLLGRGYDPFQPNIVAMSAGLPMGANPYAPGSFGRGSSASLIPPAPLPPNGMGSFGSNSVNNGFAASAQPNIVIHTSSVVLGGGTSNVGFANNSNGGNASVGGGSASLVPTAPKPPMGGGSGNGSGGGGGGGQIPGSIPSGGGFSNFARNILQNPTPNGLMNAGMGELPIGGAALISAAAYGMSVYGQAAFAGQRPQFETRLAQEAMMLRGSYTSPTLLAGQSEAASIRGNAAFDRTVLQPLNALSFGMAGMAYDMTDGQANELRAMQAENGAHSEQSLLRMAALTGTPINVLRSRYGSRHNAALGAFGDARRAIGRTTSRSPVSAALNWVTNGYFQGYANEGVGEYAFDPESTRYMGAQDALATMSLGRGANFDKSLLNDPKEFHRRFGKAFGVFGEQGVVGALGAVGHAMTGDPTQLGMYSPGSSFGDFENTRRATRVAASRGQDISSFAPLFFQNGAMDEYGQLREGRRNMQLLQNQGMIAGYDLSAAGSRLMQRQVTGAGYGELQDEMRAQGGFLNRQLGVKQQELSYAATDADRSRLASEIASLSAAIAALPRQMADVEYSQRSTGIAAAGMSASTGFQRALYSGADANGLDRAFGTQAGVSRQRASLLRQQSQRRDLDPATRAQFAAQADAAEFESSVSIPRQASQTRFGLDMANVGIGQANAADIGSRARLFGAAGDMSGVNAESVSVAANISAVKSLMERGNLSQEEIRSKTAELVQLGTRQRELAEESARGKARGEFSAAQGQFGIGSTEMNTSFLRGAGGLAGQGLAFGVSDRANAATAKAQQYVALLRSRGVAESNPEMISARQSLASSQQQGVEAELAATHTPMGVKDRMALSDARYQEEVLSMMPGSFGNIKGALRTQMKELEKEGNFKQQEYLADKARHGGVLPDFLEESYKSEKNRIGLAQAEAAQKLAHGWEGRLVSQTLGVNGNFAFAARSFTMRDAIGAGIRNSHYGSTAADRPFYLREALGDGGGSSIAGAYGTSEGFSRTALSGVAPNKNFGAIAGLPGFVGADGSGMATGNMAVDLAGGSLLNRALAVQNGNMGADTPQYSPVQAQRGGRGIANGDAQQSGSQAGGIKVIEIQLKWPDQSPAGKASIRVDKLSLGADEDSANFFSTMMRGNN